MLRPLLFCRPYRKQQRTIGASTAEVLSHAPLPILWYCHCLHTILVLTISSCWVHYTAVGSRHHPMCVNHTSAWAAV